jgi:putative glycosyltransferase (TIGR04372 family)
MFADEQVLLFNNIRFVFGGASHLMYKRRFIQLRSGTRTPAVALSDLEVDQGQRALKRLGYPLDVPIVAFHCREAGYIQGQRHNEVRNADPRNAVPALRHLIREGHVVVRLGDPTMTPLDELGHGFIDLARCGDRDSILEPYLASRCRFMIHNQSGPERLVLMFDRPALSINFPLRHGIAPEFRELLLPKLCIDLSTDRRLTFVEMAERGLLFADLKELPESFGVRFVEQDPDTITEAVKEMTMLLERDFDDGTVNGTGEWTGFAAMVEEIHQLRQGAPEDAKLNYFSLAVPGLRFAEAFLRRFPDFTVGPFTDAARERIRAWASPRR